MRTLVTFAAAILVVLSAAYADDGSIDQAFTKPGGKRSWGEIFNWATGASGFDKSYALVIGISDYKGGFEPLRSTKNDPIRMKDFLLEEAGFDHVHVLTDEKVTSARLKQLLLDDYRTLIGKNDKFLFYWSGHGIPVSDFEDENLGYLPLTASKLGSLASMIGMQELLYWSRFIEAKQTLYLLDTCVSGLASLVESKAVRPDETIDLLSKPSRHLMTATTGQQQTIAARRWSGSIFTDSFIRGARGEADAAAGNYSKDGIVHLSELLSFIRQRVDDERRRAEWPDAVVPRRFDLRENEGEFFFVTKEKKIEVAKLEGETTVFFEDGMPIVVMGAGKQKPVVCDSEADKLYWESIKSETQPAYFEAYLARVKAGELCGLFKDIARLRTETVAAEPQIAVGVFKRKPGEEFRDCPDCPSMVVVPGGNFTMGSPADEWGRYDDEGPQHDVTVAPFAISKHEVTFAQWDACVAKGGCNGHRPNDRGWGRDTRPVINVTWEDAQAYVNWLSTQTGQPYRLPSEAEWEYAARAGTTTSYAFGEYLTEMDANFGTNVGQTTEVGSYPANPWGLHDMHGNVREWVQDCYHGSYDDAPKDGSAWEGKECINRVARDGSWFSNPWLLRSAFRNKTGPGSRGAGIGFRVARTLTP